MRVLVTGAAGFIGASLYMYLRERGYGVVGVDSFERPCNPLLSKLENESYPVIKLDILDGEGLVRLLDDVDAVVHLAAYIDVGESMGKPYLYIENNVLGTASVLEACRSAGVDKFIYVSSAAVYGDPVYLPIDEGHPLKPLSPYGYSKLLGEGLARMYSDVYGLDVVVLRLFNVYGPGQIGEYSGVISRFVDRVLRGLPPVIYGDGMQTRDFIYIDDVCDAILASINYGSGFDVFNIASGRGVSIRELAELLIGISGLELEPIYGPARKGDIRHSVADVSKARKYLGFVVKTDLESGLRELLGYCFR